MPVGKNQNGRWAVYENGLDLSPNKLDAAVFDAYGWPADLADDEHSLGCWR
ncbi:MAG TPA: hypothetical protein VIK18_13745 [Pirellulales bacterium]